MTSPPKNGEITTSAVIDVGAVAIEDDWQRWCQRFDKTHNGIVRLFHDRAIWRTILAMLDDNPAVTRGGHGEY